MVKISTLTWRKQKTGVSIRMHPFPNEHHPAHFHVVYPGGKAFVLIEDYSVLAGKLPTIVHKEVFE